jgi:hypothetical protein
MKIGTPTLISFFWGVWPTHLFINSIKNQAKTDAFPLSVDPCAWLPEQPLF